MKVNVQGIGWIDERGYGCVRQGIRQTWPTGADRHSLWRDRQVFVHAVRNAARFNRLTQTTCYAAALALRDAAARYEPGARQDIGLLGACGNGTLAANHEYFRDYVGCGRTLARGNLFIYTLPTSPLAEAAIHFGFQGPAFCEMIPGNALPALIETAAGIVRRGEATAMLVVLADEASGVCLVLAAPGRFGHDGLCRLEDATRQAEAAQRTADTG